MCPQFFNKYSVLPFHTARVAHASQESATLLRLQKQKKASETERPRYTHSPWPWPRQAHGAWSDPRSSTGKNSRITLQTPEYGPALNSSWRQSSIPSESPNSHRLLKHLWTGTAKQLAPHSAHPFKRTSLQARHRWAGSPCNGRLHPSTPFCHGIRGAT